MSEELTGAAEAAIPTNDVVPAAAPVQEAPASPAEPAEASLDDILSAAYDKANSEPERGPDGKFVSTKEPEAVEPEDAAPVEAQAEDQTSPEAETPEPAKPAIEPPASWSREVREKWASVPPDVQEYIARRETEAHGQISRLGQQVKAFEPVTRTLEQYKGTFERNGLGYDKGLEALLAAQSMLDANPRAAILEIARTYGVDLGATASTDSPGRDTLALQAQVAELQRQIAETRTDVRSTREKEEQARLAALESEVETFAKANTYFRDVEAEVVQIIPVLRSQEPGLSERQLLEKAYSKAVRLNDAVWAKVQAEKQAKAAKEAAEKAAKAQKVQSLNVKSNTAARPAARSLEDDLAATFDRIQSRAS